MRLQLFVAAAVLLCVGPTAIDVVSVLTVGQRGVGRVAGNLCACIGSLLLAIVAIPWAHLPVFVPWNLGWAAWYGWKFWKHRHDDDDDWPGPRKAGRWLRDRLRISQPKPIEVPR